MYVQYLHYKFLPPEFEIFQGDMDPSGNSVKEAEKTFNVIGCASSGVLWSECVILQPPLLLRLNVGGDADNGFSTETTETMQATRNINKRKKLPLQMCFGLFSEKWIIDYM